MGIVNDINNTIYTTTYGTLGVAKPNDEKTSFVKDVGESAGRYCMRPMNDENNTVHENNERIRKVSALASIVIADHVEHKQQSMYAKINPQNAETQAFLSSFGYGNTAQNAASDMLSKGFSAIEIVKSNTPDNFTGNIDKYSINNITKAEISSLKATGSFTREVNGKQVVFTANAANKETVMKTLRAADDEVNKNRKVFNAHGVKKQVAAMRELRSASLSNMKNSGIDVKSGSLKDLRKAKEDLVKAKEAAVRAGDGAKVALIDSKISKIDKHKELFGGTDQAQSRRSAKQRRAYGMIKHAVLGSDISTGVQTYAAVGKATAMSAKAAYRLVDAAVFNIEKVIPGTKELHTRHEEYRERAKEKARAKKNGTKRDYDKKIRETKRVKRADNNAKRMLKSDARFEAKQTTLRNRGESARADKRDMRRRNKQERRKERQKRKDSRNNFFGKVSDAFSKVTKFFQPVANIINFPANAVGKIKDLVRKIATKFLIVPAGIAVLVMIFIVGITELLFYVPYFISDNIATNFAGMLNSANYVQIIVDDVSDTLGKKYVEVAKTDAINHFLDIEGEHAVPSDGLTWHMAPTEGEVGDVTSAEDGRHLPGINENLLPIISAMHARYYDNINFEQWQTARGYAYYMYVATHEVLGYDYNILPPCANEALYQGDVNQSEIDWDVSSKTLSRLKTELCTNVYFHGYDSELNKTLNKAKGASTEALNKALSILGLDFSFDTSSYGVFLDIPSDNDGTCNNYEAVQYGDTVGVDNVCGKIQHLHTEGNCNTDACSHTCDESCCSKSHPHSHSCNDNDCEHVCDSSCCSIEYHEHEDWTVSDPGCWQTAYICLGHCGGHIVPQINVEVDMTFENIAVQDNFKTTYFLSEADFSEDWRMKVFASQTLAEWKEAWNKKMASWFFPFPNSPGDLVEAYAKWYISNVAEGVDVLTGWISGLFGGASESDVKNAIKADEGKDLYGFTGWYTESGEINKAKMSELKDIYGTYETDYSEGAQAWEEGFEVVFPTGFCRAMRATQIDDVLRQYEYMYPGLSESRKAVLKQAMEYAGEFWYDLSTHTQSASATEGRIDCSGFVSSVLAHAVGWKNDWTASQFASAGHYYGGDIGSLSPGDVVAMNTTSSWNAVTGWNRGEANHVVIFMGCIPEGVEGYPDGEAGGYFIMECSSTQGGSKLRKVSTSFFESYPYVYNGCY